MALGIFFTVLAVFWFIYLLNQPDIPPPPEVKRPSFPLVAQMPEDIGRIEMEVYDVCKQYANLDLSGLVNLCKRVGYQE